MGGAVSEQREMVGRISAGGSVAWGWMPVRGRTCDQQDDPGVGGGEAFHRRIHRTQQAPGWDTEVLGSHISKFFWID